MYLIYPAIFHHEDNSYWVEFPDLAGCHTFGETVEETMKNAKEALESHCLALLEEKEFLPKASDIRNIKPPADGFTSLVESDITAYLQKNKAVKKTLTIPGWLNEKATECGINFSKTLQDALIEKLDIVR